YLKTYPLLWGYWPLACQKLLYHRWYCWRYSGNTLHPTGYQSFSGHNYSSCPRKMLQFLPVLFSWLLWPPWSPIRPYPDRPLCLLPAVSSAEPSQTVGLHLPAEIISNSFVAHSAIPLPVFPFQRQPPQILLNGAKFPIWTTLYY